MSSAGVLETWRSLLPEKFITDETRVITMYEGDTPLVEAERFGKNNGFAGKIYFLLEGSNPTGSFKDRGMTSVITKAVENGAEGVLCASTGNTSAAAAAYSARAGIKCFVILPKNGIALGKLSQALAYGATVLQVAGSFDDAFSIVRKLGETMPLTIVNSVNKNRLPGQMTAAYEIWSKLGRVPDYHFIPVGNGANIFAYWLGYQKFRSDWEKRPRATGFETQTPRKEKMFRVHGEQGEWPLPQMMGWQARGASPIVEGKPFRNPKTVATAIKIGNPSYWQKAVKARDESRGLIGAVTDDEITETYQMLARLEGIFCEPASAAGPAGFLKMLGEKDERLRNSEDTTVVFTLTGNGLKDPAFAKKLLARPDVYENSQTIQKAIEKLL